MTPDVNSSYRFNPRRELGRTGFVASVLGIGDLADRNVPFEECVATVRRAMDAGLNVIDTAPRYEDGYSERIVGAAVRDCRERMFVIDKIDFFDQPVMDQVEGSLARLGLDSTDCFVFHGLSNMEDWEHMSAPRGAFDELASCVKAGKTRFRGISSHHPEVLKAAIVSGLCDITMFAVGPFCDPRFIDEVLPLAKRKGVGTICFKTFGAGKLVCDTEGYGRPLSKRPRGKVSSGGAPSDEPLLPHLEARECVRYTLTCDPDVALLGLSFPNEQDPAFAAAADFKPMTSDEMEDLRRRAVEAMQDKGGAWWNPG
jgi:aryl-alcohol dehydrogenase-like predicted oxidoreductase